jgi:hypothetical protein
MSPAPTVRGTPADHHLRSAVASEQAAESLRIQRDVIADEARRALLGEEIRRHEERSAFHRRKAEGGERPIPVPAAEDTAAGCRARAVADLDRSGGMDTQNGRAGFERSAASWNKRADLLQEEEETSDARRAAAAAEWAEEDRQEARFERPDDR